MATIDNRVVYMQFDNQQFQIDIDKTIKSLDALTAALQLDGATTGLNNLSVAAGNMPLDGVASGVENISSKFNVLGAIGFTIIQSLTRGFLDLGGTMLNAITGPLVEGGKKRALNIEQAKFQFKGLGLNVNKTMANAKSAVLGTAYGLDEAAKAAAMFGASGMKSGAQMTKSLRAIAGVAAMSGDSYSNIADIFTKVAGQGRLMGDDLNRMSSRGINAAATLAKAMHKPEAAIRGMVTDGKISFKQFTAAMDGAFGKHAQDANKTYTGALANMKAAMARIGADYFTYKFEAMRRVFVALTPVIDALHAILLPLVDVIGKGLYSAAAKAVTYLNDFGFGVDKAGKPLKKGVETIKNFVDGIKNIINAVKLLLKPISDAFNELFPAKSSNALLDFSREFYKWSITLAPTKETVNKIASAVKFLISMFTSGKDLIRSAGAAIAKAFNDIFVATGFISTLKVKIGELVTNIGAFFTSIKETAKTSTVFQDALTAMHQVITSISDLIKSVFLAAVDRMNTAFGQVSTAGTKMRDSFVNSFSGVFKIFKVVADTVTNSVKSVNKAFESVGQNAQVGFGDSTIIGIVGAITAALTGGAIVGFVKIITGLFDTIEMFLAPLGRLTKSIAAVIDSASGALEGMQNALNAQALKSLAVAVAILAAAMLVISFIKPDRLTASATAITFLVASLMGVIYSFSKIDGGKTGGIMKATGALTLLGLAILVLAVSVKMMSSIDLVGLGKGLTAVGLLLTMLAVFISTVAKQDLSKSNMTEVGKGLLLVSFALAVMAVSLKILSTISLENMATALLGMTLGLAAMVQAIDQVPKDSAGKAGAIIIVAGAMMLLALSLKLLATMSWDDLSKSLLAMSVSLGFIVILLQSMANPEVVSGALALLIVAASLLVLSVALKALGALSVKTIATGLITLAAAFLIIGVAGVLLVEAIPGMVALALVIVSIGASIFLAGLGVVMFGAGMMSVANAMKSSGQVLIKFITDLGALLPILATDLANFIGAFAIGLADQETQMTAALTTLFNTVLVALNTVLPALVTFLSQLITACINILLTKIPEIVIGLNALLLAIIVAFTEFMPVIEKAATDLIVAFIDGMSTSYDRINTAGANFIIKLMEGIGREANRMADAAMKTIIKFVNGLTTAINTNGPALDTAVKKLIDAIITEAGRLTGLDNILKIGRDIVDGIAAGINNAISAVTGAITGTINAIAQAARDAGLIKSPSRLMMPIGNFLVRGLAVGIDNAATIATKSASNVITAAYSAMQLANDAANNILLGVADPVIKPVVDLDAVTAGAQAISSLMANAASVQVSSDVSARMGDQTRTNPTTPETNTTGNPPIVFEQNNYSPKALDRLEIYRNTRNQLQLLKGLG